MKSAAALTFSFLSLLQFGVSIPQTKPQGPVQYNSQSFVFNAAAATYSFSIVADGQQKPTNVSSLNVDHIRTPNFDAFSQCAFYGPSGRPLYSPPLTRESAGVIAVGPPQPIASISCKPSTKNNQCLPDYSDCEYTSPTTGVYVLNCCSGICAATKCRPRPS